MIPSDLDLIRVEVDRRLPNPESYATLRNQYFHGGDIRLGTPQAELWEENSGRIISLRANKVASYALYSGGETSGRGYFAYGNRRRRDSRFEIWVPHGSCQVTFPPDALQNIVGRFLLVLTNEGFEIPAHAVKFHAPSKP